jgi:hypothetical protein
METHRSGYFLIRVIRVIRGENSVRDLRIWMDSTAETFLGGGGKENERPGYPRNTGVAGRNFEDNTGASRFGWAAAAFGLFLLIHCVFAVETA